jgi:cytochrome c556
MVHIDERLDHLKEIRAADWKVPHEHPDLDAPHEALQLLEHYREAARLEDIGRRTEKFRRQLNEAERSAQELEKALRQKQEERDIPSAVLEKAYQKVSTACTQCHAKYRDVPQVR